MSKLTLRLEFMIYAFKVTAMFTEANATWEMPNLSTCLAETRGRACFAGQLLTGGGNDEQKVATCRSHAHVRSTLLMQDCIVLGSCWKQAMRLPVRLPCNAADIISGWPRAYSLLTLWLQTYIKASDTMRKV